MNIVVYCGASEGNLEIYKESTINLGKWIAKNNHTLVYGGGNIGLMGLLADTVLQNNGDVIGVIPEFLIERELSHQGLTELHIVNTISERKTKMINLGHTCIALPGGPSTLEEITEVVSWSRVGENNSPCIFLNVNNYYKPMEDMYDDMVKNVFLTLNDREKTLFSDSLEVIENFIVNYEKPSIRSYK
ncbi:TIGR00730 family Rossman fold protein [Staphylococcus equorum]|uniref:LOG family protein n=1 Tax=Staphylococcus equorum TaxID=246432 RepID=UPI003CF174E0